MARRVGPVKVRQYSLECKLKAVNATRASHALCWTRPSVADGPMPV